MATMEEIEKQITEAEEEKKTGWDREWKADKEYESLKAECDQIVYRKKCEYENLRYMRIEGYDRKIQHLWEQLYLAFEEKIKEYCTVKSIPMIIVRSAEKHLVEKGGRIKGEIFRPETYRYNNQFMSGIYFLQFDNIGVFVQPPRPTDKSDTKEIIIALSDDLQASICPLCNFVAPNKKFLKTLKTEDEAVNHEHFTYILDQSKFDDHIPDNIRTFLSPNSRKEKFCGRKQLIDVSKGYTLPNGMKITVKE